MMPKTNVSGVDTAIYRFAPRNPEPLYWTAKEVGLLLQLSDKSIYRLAKSDPTFPMTIIGGARRFPRVAVLRWLDNRTQGRPA
jgi:predicted DNA-binding transcriptional regulator AlpA